MTYGGTVPTITSSYSGFVNGDTAASLSTAPSCTTIATSSSPASPPTYPSTCSGAADSNYTISYVAGAVTVLPATLTVTASSPSMTYGGAVANITPSYSGFVNGQNSSVLTTAPVCTTTATNTSAVGSSPTTSCSGAAAPNYTFSYVAGAVTVLPATVTVTASSPSMTYGGTAPTITPSYSGFANGENSSVVTTPPVCTSAATSTSGVGSSPTTSCTGAAAANYTFSYVAGAVTVLPAAVTVTASNGTMTYGGTPPTITPSYAGFENGQDSSVVSGISCSAGATAASPVGSYASSCSGASAANYTFSYVNGTVTVMAASASVTPNAATKVYGTADPSLTGTLSGFLAADNVTATYARTAGETVGTYTISATLAPAGVLSNYNITYNTANFTITAAPASVTPNAATKVYGASDPSLTGTLSGFLAADNVTATYTHTAGETVGTYTISATLAPTGVLNNYNITYNTANFTITPAALVITASSATMTYGGAVPTITASYSGFVNGDTVASLTTPPTCSTAATSHSPAGSYPSSCTGAVDSNYAISYVGGTVTDSVAALLITASSATMTYGGAVPTITASYGGFVNGDTVASLTTPPSCSTTATSHSPAGSYPSSCSGAVDSDYAISYVGGAVTDSTAALVITASSATMTPGGTMPTITPSYSGFVNGDTAASLTTPPTCSTTATPSSPAGFYPSTCSGAVDSNYAISYVSGTVTVTAVSAPQANLSASSLTFSAQIVGTSSAAQTVKLTNTGNVSLTIFSITAFTDFSQTNTCGTNLSAGANCTISVTFKPKATGTRTGSLSILDNATGSPQIVGLSGTGLVFTSGPHPPILPPRPPSPGPGQPIRVVSPAPIVSAPISVPTPPVSAPIFKAQGVGTSSSAQTDTCGTTGSSDANCANPSSVNPVAAGTSTSAPGVSDNPTGSQQTAAPSGTGPVSPVGPNPPVLPPSPQVNPQPQPAAASVAPLLSMSSSSLVFSAQRVGTSSSAQTVTLTNMGNSPLTISSIKVRGGFSQTNTCGATLSAGDKCAISVTFTPVAAGKSTGTLGISNNLTGSPQTVALRGTGLVASVDPGDPAPEHPKDVQ
jgi:hypothetical protein